MADYDPEEDEEDDGDGNDDHPMAGKHPTLPLFICAIVSVNPNVYSPLFHSYHASCISL